MFAHRTILWVCLFGGGSSCTRPVAPVEQATLPKRAVVAERATVDAGIALTDAKVLAFVAYQDTVFALAVADAGTAEVMERARRDAQARAASGLSSGELDALEELVSTLAEKRWLNRWVGSEQVTAKIQAWAEEASEAHKKFVAGTLSSAEAQEDLSAERAKFGDGNVSLVLKHEARLYEAWQAQLKR